MPGEDRRVEKTKRIIDDACWALLQEKTLEEITVRDIADYAKINRATFYRYHVDKYDWLEKKILVLLQELMRLSAPLYVTRQIPAITIAFETIFCHFEEHFQEYSILIRNRSTAIFHEYLQTYVLEMNRKYFPNDARRSAHSELVMHFGVSAMAGVIEWWFQNNRPLTPQQMAHELCAIHTRWLDHG